MLYEKLSRLFSVIKEEVKRQKSCKNIGERIIF